MSPHGVSGRESVFATLLLPHVRRGALEELDVRLERVAMLARPRRRGLAEEATQRRRGEFARRVRAARARRRELAADPRGGVEDGEVLRDERRGFGPRPREGRRSAVNAAAGKGGSAQEGSVGEPRGEEVPVRRLHRAPARAAAAQGAEQRLLAQLADDRPDQKLGGGVRASAFGRRTRGNERAPVGVERGRARRAKALGPWPHRVKGLRR